MPDKGSIGIKGKVGALIEVGAGFHPLLTGRENIYVNGVIPGMSKKETMRSSMMRLFNIARNLYYIENINFSIGIDIETRIRCCRGFAEMLGDNDQVAISTTPLRFTSGDGAEPTL